MKKFKDTVMLAINENSIMAKESEIMFLLKQFCIV